VRPFVLYSLRHSFATKLASHVDAWTLCKIMGWSSLSVAMTYVHPSEDRVLEVISGLGGHKIGHSAENVISARPGELLLRQTGSKEYLVSAAGFEPATHALKGHCSTN